MIRIKKVLAIVPARGGSKSIPYKNLADLDGKPLLVHAIEQGQGTKLVDKVVVSTDDEKIAAVGKKYCEVIMRPAELATDTAKMSGVLQHVLEQVKTEGYEIVVLLQPTSPFRTSAIIDAAIKAFEKHYKDFDMLMPLKPIEAKVGHVREDGSYEPLFKLDMQRQELKPLYAEGGTVYVYKAENILAGDPIGKKHFAFIIEDEIETIDIDEPQDLEIAQAIARRRTP